MLHSNFDCFYLIVFQPDVLTEVTILSLSSSSLVLTRIFQANFVDNLAVDYNKWSTDEEYRKYRASLSEKVVIDDEEKEDEIIPAESEEFHDAPIEVSSRTNRNISRSRKSSRLKRALSKFSRRHKRMQESSETCL